MNFPMLSVEIFEELLVSSAKAYAGAAWEFAQAYVEARGDTSRMTPVLLVQRDRAIRTMLRVWGRSKEIWWTSEGEPTPDHWRLLAWAYTPTSVGRLLDWLAEETTGEGDLPAA